MPEPADDDCAVVQQARIGGEYQVGQACNRRHSFELDAGVFFQHAGEGPPLGLARFLVHGIGEPHPRVDFVLNPEMIRWANQEACHFLAPPAEFLRQLSKEGSRIHHEADGLEAAAVAEFGRNGRVDIHAHGGNFRRQAVPGGDGVQRRRHQYREPDSREGGAHGRLGVSRVRDDVGQWSIVADASANTMSTCLWTHEAMTPSRISPDSTACLRLPAFRTRLMVRR